MRYLLFIILTVIAYCCKSADYGLKSAPVVASWTPLSTSSGGLPQQQFIQVWLKAESLQGSNNGDALTFWADSSGKDANATNVLTSNQYVTNNVVNGYPAVFFNGNTKALTITHDGVRNALNNTPGITVFNVNKRHTNPGTTVYLYSIESANMLNAFGNFGTWHRITGSDLSNTYFSDGAEWINRFVFYSIRSDYSSGTVSSTTNGVLSFNTTSWVPAGNTKFKPTDIRVGSGFTSYGCLSYLSELLIYSTNLTTPEVLQVQNYFSNKFRLWP